MDNLILSFIYIQCEKMGALLLADFMGINRFQLGLFMYIILIGSVIGYMGVKKNVH